jgi:hypothetical protein
LIHLALVNAAWAIRCATGGLGATSGRGAATAGADGPGSRAQAVRSMTGE